VTGVEVAVGFLIVWMTKKIKRAAGRLDTEIDYAVDAGMDRLHTLIADKLGGDSAFAKLHAEIDASGVVTPRTRERVRLAIEDVAADDLDFGQQLDSLVEQIRSAQDTGVATTTAQDHSVAATGDVTLSATDGSVVGLHIRDVSIDRGDRRDPRPPGRSRC
jgi:hypothetical protein